MATRHRFEVDGESHTVVVDEVDGRLSVVIDDGEPVAVDATNSGLPGLFSLIRDGVPARAYVVREGRNFRVIVDGRTFTLAPAGAAGRQRGTGGSADPPGHISAPLAGVVVDIRTEVGARIEVRQTVVVIEAMKMQNEVLAPLAGEVTAIRCQQGARVEKGELLVEYTPDEAE